MNARRGGPAAVLAAVGGAAFGLLATIAAGAVATAGLDLTVPDLLSVESPPDVLRYSVVLGLGGLRVPLDLSGITGTLAPLTSGAAAFAAIAWAVGTRGAVASRRVTVAVVSVSFAVVCAVAALLTRGSGGASAGWAGATGLAWGAAAAFWGTSARAGGTREGPSRRVLLGWAGGLAAAWAGAGAVVLLVLGKIDGARFGGIVPLIVAFAPNVLSALVALGCGARVELGEHSTDGASIDALEGVALWDWNGGAAPWYVLALAALPLVASVVAAAASPDESRLRRGVRNGVVLGATVALLGWAGSYQATVRASGDAATIRVGIDVAPAFLLGIAWGIAGSFVASWLPWPLRRPRVVPP
ncbi:MAG: hypothetical protein ABR613_06890 [Actinomycetota bacterium]